MNAIRWEKIALFAGLSFSELELVSPMFEQVRIKAGQAVLTEGEDGEDMYILVQGKVRIVKSMLLKNLDLMGHEPRKVLATLTGDAYPVFGEMALIDDAPRSATVETLEPSVFLRVHRDRFFELAKSHPDLGCKLLAAVGKRLAAMVRTSNGEVVKLTTALALLLQGKR